MNLASLSEMFKLGWPIFSVLLFCSILSIAVILERLVYFRRRNVNVKDFFSKIERIIESGKDASNHCSDLKEPMCSIVRGALHGHSKARGNLDLVVDRAIRMQVADMERFVPLLGTVASAAPFIGLLGTVIGIIRAFKSIAVSGGGGPQVVALGISEALVATALGLFVAIPALVAYNHFSTRIRRLTESMEICADEVVELLSKK